MQEESLGANVACNPTIRQTPEIDFLTLHYLCYLRVLLFKKNSEQEVTEVTENSGFDSVQIVG